MIVEYTVEMAVDFPEETIDKIVKQAKENKWDVNRIKTAVDSETCGFDDDVFYTWGAEQTNKVVEEIRRRLEERQLALANYLAGRLSHIKVRKFFIRFPDYTDYHGILRKPSNYLRHLPILSDRRQITHASWSQQYLHNTVQQK